MNPYQVPGPDAPLCPFHTPEHERYYVPVDNTQEAYEQFQQQMGDLRSLRDEGRLVVVSGQRGCGKTALINRCATWLQKSLGDLGVEGMIFPLTHEGLENQPIDHRKNHIFQCIIDDLWRCGRLSEDDRTKGLREGRDSLDIAYRYLSGVLADNLVTIALLPPSMDLIKEVEDYAKYARKRIVFFVESSFVDKIEKSWPDICNAGRTTPVRLEVGPLRAHDGWLFTRARQELFTQEHQTHNTKVQNFRRVSKETVYRMTDGWETSIGQLQALLSDVYQDLDDQTGSERTTASDEITYEDITHHFFKLFRDR